jgi:hypothetical protein
VSVRTCDGTDDGLIMYIDIVGDPVDHPEFAVTYITCDCGSIFDDAKHDLTWPHRYLPPNVPIRGIMDLPNTAGYL